MGTGRSGTTLLQSMLASHPEIQSWPETHFFRRTIPKWRWMRPFKWYSSAEREFVQKFLRRIQREELVELLPEFTFSRYRWAASLLNILDELALENNKTVWLEKTPMHLYYIDIIHKVEPSTIFVHLIRRGEDVVASLYDVSRKYPEYFSGPQSINRCIWLWKWDFRISKKYLGRENHIHILYENLVEEPETILKIICRRLDIPFDKSVLDHQEQAGKLRFPEEEWKQDSSQPVQKGSKFMTVFTEKQRLYISRMLRSADLSQFELKQ